MMKTVKIFEITSLFMVLCGFVRLDADENAGSKQTWFTSYSEALQIARRTGKPLFVVFRCQH